MEALGWTVAGLLLAILGVEAWLVRREKRRKATVRPQLVREPAPLEEPKVLGRMRR